MNRSRLSLKNWIGFFLIGFVGQIAWAIENNYINLWVFSQTQNVSYITAMTMTSAVVAAVTTFFMGVLSDRLGKRKVFISLGYLIWGISVSLFGVMSYKNMASLFPLANTIFLVGVANVLVDCIMTFFGSTSNDACFNAYVTDVTDENNRNIVEAILSVLPLFALGLMIVIGGILGVPGESKTANEIAPNWFKFFLIFGAITSLIGLISFFLLPKDSISPQKDRSYFKELIHGFRLDVIKENKVFYITLVCFMFFNIAIDSFMPYYLVYFTNDVSLGGLGLSTSYLPVVITIMGVSSLSIICLGLFLDKLGPLKFLIPSILLVTVGSVLFLIGTNITLVIICGIITIFGYLLGTTVLGAELRKTTPKDEVGLFQGVRMILTVMLPMIIGSELGKLSFNGAFYLDANGQTVYAPTKWMFLVSAIAALVALIPTIILLRETKKASKEAN